MRAQQENLIAHSGRFQFNDLLTRSKEATIIETFGELQVYQPVS